MHRDYNQILIKSGYLFLLISELVCSSLKAQTYNYYYGNIHAHTSYSDGNKDSVLFSPLQAFNYAKTSQHLDFYGISEHNHVSAGLSSPADYHKGIADAKTANADGSFVALYGMEWGVISGGGHVLIYGFNDSLIGWDSGNYDVYVAQHDYSALWKNINSKQGAFAYLAHPQTTDYNNLFSAAYDVVADSAIIGMAARSGPAFSTSATYSDPSAGNYIARYNDALKLGYHVGVGLDHDTHNSVFGKQTAGRLVVLANSLTGKNIMEAFRKMRFYSSDDWNVKVNFTIASQPMGSICKRKGSPGISVQVTDPDGEQTTGIEVYYGVPGSGTQCTVLYSTANSNTLSYAPVIANNATYYYYLKIIQADGDVIWTSPIWYTRDDSITTEVKNEIQGDELLVFPNPVTNNFTLDLDKYNGEKRIELVDASGRLVLEQKSNENRITLNPGKISNGNYFIKVFYAGKMYSKQIVIDKAE